MRYGSDHKQLTRHRILRGAAKQIREGGIQSVSLSRVMAESGLTHGGFYAHFASKNDFIMAAIQGMFADSPSAILKGEGVSARDALEGFVDYYLSPEHRDTRTSGCPLPFVCVDAPRLTVELRAYVAAACARMRETVLRHLAALHHGDPGEAASSCVGEMIGAVIMARAEPDRTEADAILARSRMAVRKRLGLE